MIHFVIYDRRNDKSEEMSKEDQNTTMRNK